MLKSIFVWTPGSTQTPGLQSFAFVMDVVWGWALSHWKERLSWKKTCSWGNVLLWNLHIPFSIDFSFPDVHGVHSLSGNAPPYHQKYRLLNWALISIDLIFQKCSWAPAVISVTESCLILNQCHLRAQISRGQLSLLAFSHGHRYLYLII